MEPADLENISAPEAQLLRELTGKTRRSFNDGRQDPATQGGEGPLAEKLAKGGPRGVGVILYLNLGDTDIDQYYQDVRQAGATFIEPIQDQFWGDRTFTIEDPDGYILTFAKHVRDVDFSQMPSRQE